MAPQTLIAQVSPNGNIEAIVEQDERVAFFYLHGAPDIDFGVRSCWVRNLRPAPSSLDVAGMREGATPMLPLQHCVHPEGAVPLRPDDLSVVWFEEGDGAALLERGEVLAIIPSWSGQGGFEGYARDCSSESTLCWPLLPTNALHDRVNSARNYWAAWDRNETPWDQVQKAEMAAYSTHLGAYEKYYGIDGGEWPPRALLRIPSPGGLSLVTVGVCLRPQPAVELVTEKPEEYRRVEIGGGLASEAISHFEAFARYIGGQANLPWSVYSWLGPGHTIPCDAFPGTEFTAVVLVRHLSGFPDVKLPPFREEPVNLLWMIPITSTEREYAMRNSGEQLAERLADAGVSWLFRPRKPVA
jgi:Suppressor of fused protein (SUFU)